MDTWRLLKTPPTHGAWNMAVDEAILEAVGRGSSLPTLRLYTWEPACLSLGYAQPFSDVDLASLQRLGWEVVRRPTGGRAVLHTDELTYSVIAPHSEPRVAGSVLEAYQRLARALVEALKILGLEVEMNAGSSTHPGSKINPVCFEVPSAYEITVAGKKLVGSAQARRKEGVLQHGSLPLTGDLSRILQVLSFPNEDARNKAAGRLMERAVTVENAVGHTVSWEEAAEAFDSAFHATLALELQAGALTRAELDRTEELILNKYGNASWTERGKSLNI